MKLEVTLKEETIRELIRKSGHEVVDEEALTKFLKDPDVIARMAKNIEDLVHMYVEGLQPGNFPWQVEIGEMLGDAVRLKRNG